MDKKKKHHYVWRFYLKSWATNEKIFCKMDDKVFKSNLMGIAQERFFYKMIDLTENELNIVNKLFIDNASPTLKIMHREFLNMYTSIYKLKKSLSENIKKSQNFDKTFEIFEANFNEDYHSKIEESNIEYINSILNKDITFWNDETNKMTFLYFITTQYFRTKNIKNNVIESVSQYSFIDIKRIWPVISHIVSITLSNNLFLDSNFKLYLLINNTKIEFITSDQPIINLSAINSSLKEEVDDLEFYYPIAPSIAILLSDKNHKQQYILLDNDSNVKYYNDAIIKESYKQIYASKEETLKKINTKV